LGTIHCFAVLYNWFVLVLVACGLLKKAISRKSDFYVGSLRFI